MTTTAEDEYNALYGSKYLSVSDLRGRKPKCTIANVEIEDLKDKNGAVKRKYILSFEGKEKTMVLNKTNAEKMAAAFGLDRHNWIGERIELYSVETSMGPGLRIAPIRDSITPAKIPQQKPPPQSLQQAADDLDDEIPF